LKSAHRETGIECRIKDFLYRDCDLMDGNIIVGGYMRLSMVLDRGTHAKVD
jgi:hypothetical protein